ncbi:HEPN domain-containing protein [Desulfovibrio sp. JC010]|uniref:HEPN domain-containing protein n=1 Tax=Desulfovibrio sp. JC010 TaxID=2593641 RepID=UPI0013D4DFFD|nr:HEPN domain-containing protein [Desulfovibrio sp. JC010]NDV26897.1 hypothetical protein [Desulfovibrio sp. JC010]
MPYSARFTHADDLIADISNLQRSSEPMLKSKYAGVVSVLAASVYECAVKKILLSFARSRDQVFFNYVQKSFSKINARIAIKSLKNDYLKNFGDAYRDAFSDLLETEDDLYLRNTGKSITSSYSNLIIWRHAFVHDAECPINATLEEAIESYELGKKVIECFYVSTTSIS